MTIRGQGSLRSQRKSEAPFSPSTRTLALGPSLFH